MLLIAHRAPTVLDGRLPAAGAAVLEFDVQLADGRLVVSHFVPLVGTRGRLQRDNWRLRLSRGGRDAELKQALATVPATGSALLDLKPNDPQQRAALARAIIEEIGDLAIGGRHRVCAPWPDELDLLRAAGFTTWRTIGSRAQLDAVRAGGALADEAVTVRHSLLSARTVAALHEQVAMVIAWTVDDLARAQQLARWGVDGITTNRVDRMTVLDGVV
jgi:hypothetical protein